MAYIKKLKDNELIGGTDNTDVYPVTSTEAVYNRENVSQEYINNHVDGSKIVDGTVTTGKIANNAVAMGKLDNEVQTLIQQGADSSWTPKGDFNIGTTYDANDVVFDPVTNSSYLSLRADNTGHPVDENDEEYEEGWWMKVLDGSYVNLLEEELQQLVDRISDGTQQQVEELNEALEALEAQADQSRQDIQDIVDSLAVVQATGQSTSDIMSQKAVTDEINRINDGLYYEKNVTFGTLVNGFAINSAGTWVESDKNITYSCYVHEVKEGDIYLLKVPDAEGSKIHYAFLTTYIQPVHQQDAPFVAGTSLNFGVIAGEKIRITIPSTCKFLYIAKVYTNANIEPEYIHHILPDKDVIDDAIKEYGDILYYHTDAVNLSTLDIISGAAININSGLWAVSLNVSSVFLERDGFDVIKIVPNSNSSMIAFLTSNSLPSVSGDTPDYCDGYDNAIRIEYEQYIHLPSDCKFVWLYNAYADRSYLPQSIGLVRSVASKITDIEKAGGGTLLTKVKRLRCIAPTMNVVAATSYMVEVNPCQKIKITGATGFMWLKTDVLEIDNNYEASDYFSGWCECDENGAELYAAPDCHYLLVMHDVDVYGFEEYKDFNEHETDLLSLASYIANRSVRYIYHTYIRTMHGGGYKTALTGIGSTNEHSHRNPAALVSHLDVMLNSPTLDLGLIGTTKYALRNQCVRYLQALVDAHSLWTNKWQSSLTAAYMGSASCRMYRDGYMTQELYNLIRNIVATECDNILSKQEGERWRDGSRDFGIFGLYWKNASGTEIYSGDSKSEEVGWYAGCLGVACALCQDYPNIQEYRKKFIEFCIISYASPADIGKNESYNGYSLTNLQGSNITNDGMVINHQIIHPDYMASRCFVLFFCLRALNYANIKMPKAMLFNMKLVFSAFADYKFTEGKYLNKYDILSPYGEIMKDGSNYPYFPMGNDWGTLRQDVEAEFFSMMYALGQSPRYDCSRTATNVLATIKKLQDRFETYHSGRIVGNSSENRYGVEEAPQMQYANVGSTMVCPFGIVEIMTSDLVWTDDDWYNIE